MAALVGNGRPPYQSVEPAVLKYLRDNPHTFVTPKSLSSTLGMGRGTIAGVLSRLSERGMAVRVDRGLYRSGIQTSAPDDAPTNGSAPVHPPAPVTQTTTWETRTAPIPAPVTQPATWVSKGPVTPLPRQAPTPTPTQPTTFRYVDEMRNGDLLIKGDDGLFYRASVRNL